MKGRRSEQVWLYSQRINNVLEPKSTKAILDNASDFSTDHNKPVLL